MPHPISPDEAWRRIESQLSPLSEERLPRRAARGRTLARDLPATVDVPPLDVSAMDGYALAGAVPPGEPRPVAATLVAGDPPGFVLEAPAVVRIMTGAPVPAGADRVIPVERTANPGGRRDAVVFRAEALPGDHIRRRGEVLRAGEPLLPAGAVLTPAALSHLAAHGHAEVPVHRAPAVAVLTTGDEVVPPESAPAPGQIRDSHTDFLLAAGAALGLSFESLGIAPDREDELAALAERGLGSDVLLLCGGVSMGELDLVEGVLGRLGVRAELDAVAIQPGKPLFFGAHRRGVVFGLPGNPASVMVAFHLFVRPALLRLLGRPATWWGDALQATLAAPLQAGKLRDRFLPCRTERRDGRLLATPIPQKGSHDVAAYAAGDALVRVRPGAEPARAGERCEVLLVG
jgi:molybdopterin molybdotransferase